MLKFAKVAANTALVAEIRELLTGSAQSATRAGKKKYPYFMPIFTVQSRFSDIFKSLFSDNFAEDHFFSA